VAVSEPGVLDAVALRGLWTEVLDVVKGASRRTRALLDSAQILAVAGEQVTVGAPAALAKMIADDSNTSVLRAALTKVIGGQWQVAVEGVAPDRAAADGTAAPSVDADPRDDVDYETASAAVSAPPADPEAEALRLLRDQLGARPLES
jgi:DNA polymerase-3 subunit gamma/tau